MTGNREDYIKTIYELGGEKHRVSTTKIARALKISAPSVSEMLGKLSKEGILEYEVYKGVKLTQLGLEEAVRIKKIHILWEVFLIEKLNYNLEDVHEEAELLEHITSPKLAQGLEKFLDYPEFCPHGTPLNPDQYLFNFTPLSEAPLNKPLLLKRFKDDKDFLKAISNLNLKLGDILEISKDRDNWLSVSVNGRNINLAIKDAQKIFVEKEILHEDKI